MVTPLKSRDYILSWLSSILAPSPSPSPAHSQKRPLGDHNLNIMPGQDTSPSKRRKRSENEDLLVDCDDTPRPSSVRPPNPAQPPPAFQMPHMDSPATSQSSRSIQSRSQRPTSPVKKMADMMLNAESIVSKQFGNMDMPAELEVMWVEIERISRGVGIIPGSLSVCWKLTLRAQLGRWADRFTRCKLRPELRKASSALTPQHMRLTKGESRLGSARYQIRLRRSYVVLRRLRCLSILKHTGTVVYMLRLLPLP